MNPRARRASLAALALALSAAPALAALAPGPRTAAAPPSEQPPVRTATVEIALDRPLARFSPRAALGGGLDGHGAGETAQIYTPPNVRAMSAAGLGQISYRLRTELGVQAWHIDPAGAWSDPRRHEGYWTTTSTPPRTAPAVSWGYSLPRRGDTVDQADDTGHSSLDDGDPRSFWKSNPYLDSRLTHEPEAAHPQWVLIDLHRPRPLDALRIAWAAPWALRFHVQEFLGPSAVMIAGHPPGTWRDFPRGSFRGRPGVQTLRLAPAPTRVRFVRILLLASSHAALPGGHDIRDRLGYAIRELHLGLLDRHGRLHDLIRHTPSGAQTVIYTSSTDPWHRAADRNPGYEQPSFQTVLHSGLTHGEPLLVPVPVLYGTPANAVAELRYLRALHVPIRGVELGEEPDGQLASPEDYGALYLQFARAIHRAFPGLPLGGPGFQTSIPDWLYWPDAHGDRSWTHRFLDYLAAHRALGELGFFSFEWYPYDNVCADPAPQLAGASALLSRSIALQRRHGLPPSLPLLVTEYGYSAFAGQDEVDMPGALLDADTLGTLLDEGASAAYLYGYEPDALLQESERCETWGNLALLLSDESHRLRAPLATFWETRMLTRDWVLPGSGAHTLYATRSDALDPAGRPLVRAYALRRPDGRLGVLLLNTSPSRPYRVTLRLTRGAAGTTGAGLVAGPGGTPSGPLTGPLQEWQLSAADYRWQARGPAGRPSLDRPPVHTVLADGASAVTLPPYSVTVLRAAAPTD
ncbi:MAG TPA: discoidin domain-containing protein [Solirubrobacteraceae bacterium]|nr:discoidin domain-containing protein [Solirubrobacteraceae bacterium]